MIMYDMRESLKEVEQNDADLKSIFETQLDVVAHPDKLHTSYFDMAARIPLTQYSTTTETIFRSNIETIRTIGNILFVEAVSSFYDTRTQYKVLVIDDFQHKVNQALLDYAELRDFNTPSFIFLSEAFLHSMKVDFENCKQLMKVSDEDLEIFSEQKEKLMKTTQSKLNEDSKENAASKMERTTRLQQAREEGKKELNSKK